MQRNVHNIVYNMEHCMSLTDPTPTLKKKKKKKKNYEKCSLYEIT